MSESEIHLTAAAFYSLNGAADVFTRLQDEKKLSGVRTAVILQKDRKNQVTVQDVGLTPGKGAVTGVVLGATVGVLTGGVGLGVLALGGILGRQSVKHRRDNKLTPNMMEQFTNTLSPGSSLLLIATDKPLDGEVTGNLEQAGAEIFSAVLSKDTIQQLDDYADEAYEQLLQQLNISTATKAAVPYPRIHVVINPAAGKDEPILNTLNDVFSRYGIDWDISVTRKYGDATRFARQAAEAGFDLVAGYGGDGTQHEIANGVFGTNVMMGVLPGGTGNGFANELGTPRELRPAVELLCTSYNTRKIDVAQHGDQIFIQRLYTGIEPDEQTSREDKDKYGTFAYVINAYHRVRESKEVPYRITIDGELIEMLGTKCYIVNSATAGTGLALSKDFAVDDGMLDVFLLSRSLKSVAAAGERFLNVRGANAEFQYWRGQEISIECEPSQAVWTDGEIAGRTPVMVKVVPGALTVAVP